MSDIKPRMQEFEALRGLSILLLLALHSEVFDPAVFGFDIGPLAGVVAAFLLGSFFFLAGFFAEFSRQRSEGNLFAFIKSKFIRIFPPYWLALALFISVLGFTLKRFDTLIYILNFQWLLSPVFVKPVLTLWYISVLVGFYMIFGILLFAVRSNLGLLAGSIILFATGYWANMMFGLFEPRMFMYFFVFLAGVYFFRFEEMRKRLFEIGFGYKLILAAVVVIPFWLVSASSESVTEPLFILTALLFILGWVLLALSAFRSKIGAWRVWSFLSTASFFTYLFHRPIWKGFEIALSLEPGIGKVFVDIIPGAIVALVVGYFLQLGYDRLLSAMRLK